MRDRAGAASAVLLGDKMVVAGGWDGSQLLDSVELGAGLYSDWATVPGWRLTQARSHHCLAATGHSLVVAGGLSTSATVEMLRLDGKTWQGWQRLPSLPQAFTPRKGYVGKGHFY